MFSRLLIAIVLPLLFSCGTGVGNPEISQANQPVLPFELIVQEYQDFVTPTAGAGAVDCGSFSGDDPAGSVEDGEACIRDALSSCQVAGLLIDRTVNASGRIVSFVSIVKTEDGSCFTRTHVASSLEDGFYGYYVGYCDVLPMGEPLEFSCRP